MKSYTVRLNVVLPQVADLLSLSEAVYDRLVERDADTDLAGAAGDRCFTYWLTLAAVNAEGAASQAAEALRLAAREASAPEIDILSLEVQLAETDDLALASA